MSATYARARDLPSGRALAALSFDVLAAEGYCVLTTFHWTGTAVASRVRYVRRGNRLYVRTRAASALARRVWNTGTATVAPCARSGRALGAPLAARARLVSPAEQAVVECALAERTVRRVPVRPPMRREADCVYLELAPVEAGPPERAR